MPRYFFNLHGVGDRVDREGTELAGISELQAFMATKAADILIDAKDSAQPWRLEALDANGIIVRVITFSITRNKT